MIEREYYLDTEVAKGEHEVREYFKDDTNKKPADVRPLLKQTFIRFLEADLLFAT
jgi:hypothetical protein